MTVDLDQQQATACLWHALECLAHEERDSGLLVPGRIRIAAAIDACVAERPVMAIVGGELVVDTADALSALRRDQQIDVEHVLALALQHLSFSRMVAFQEDLVRHVTEHYSLPEVSPQSRSAVFALIARLQAAARRATRKTCRFERTVVK